MFKLPIGVDINNLIDDLRIFSWEACDILLDYSQMLKDSNFKRKILSNNNANDPVTLADLKVNDLIIRRIKENYKEVNWDILSEENVKNEIDNFDINNKFLWILDPLDGTKDFLQGTGNYAMHLALNYKNNPFIGIVLIPEKNELWISNGTNCWCERRDRSLRKISLSNKRNLEDMVLVTSKNHSNETLKRLIEKIDFHKVNFMGSIGCKIASIIRGDSDLYISLSLPGKSCPKDWDFAAPEAILKAAGGSITNIDNNDLIYGNKDFRQENIIIASNNKHTHGYICAQVKEIIQKYDIWPLEI